MLQQLLLHFGEKKNGELGDGNCSSCICHDHHRSFLFITIASRTVLLPHGLWVGLETGCLYGELVSFICGSKLPVSRSNIVGDNSLTIAGGDTERQCLWVQVIAAVLPVLSPVPVHCVPPCVGSLHWDLLHVASTCYIGDEHQHEVGIPVDAEANAPSFHTRYSAAAAESKGKLKYKKNKNQIWSQIDLICAESDHEKPFFGCSWTTYIHRQASWLQAQVQKLV